MHPLYSEGLFDLVNFSNLVEGFFGAIGNQDLPVQIAGVASFRLANAPAA